MNCLKVRLFDTFHYLVILRRINSIRNDLLSGEEKSSSKVGRVVWHLLER